MQLRDATDAVLAGVLTIYNEVIANSTAVYATEAVTLAERRDWLRGRTKHGYPVLVAIDASGVAGFASFGEWRGSCNDYRYTVEHSVHVRANMRARGIGRELLEALVPRARPLGTHVMIGDVDATNSAAIRFHGRLGFAPVAHFREFGHKFGRRLDLVFMQRLLGPAGEPRAH